MSERGVLIETKRLTRALTGDVAITLVDSASVTISKGEFVVITGPSGSGKSSLLYLLGLLDRPTSGSLTFLGREMTTLSDNERADIRLQHLGFVFQFHFLLPEFTALENVMLPMRRLGKRSLEEGEAHAVSLLSSLGLREQMKKYPRQLSGGQAQRVAIARALANDPQVILADEPTGNLDTASSANVQSVLREITSDGERTVIAVTHDPHFAERADRVISIVDGKIEKTIAR
jgi:lipoprotein-releasing system ATP-binding protein